MYSKQTDAEKGIELLNQLKEKAQDQITIIPGGGINSTNTILFKVNGFKEIHASASKVFFLSVPAKISYHKQIMGRNLMTDIFRSTLYSGITCYII